MRLDHLLSKEQGKVERPELHPKVDRAGEPAWRAVTGQQSARREAPSERTLSVQEEGKLLEAARRNLYRFQGSVKTKNVKIMWGFSSAGRAPALQAGGQRFDPANLHQENTGP